MVEQSDFVDKSSRGWKSTSRDIELTQISFTGVQGTSCAFHTRFQFFPTCQDRITIDLQTSSTATEHNVLTIFTW